MCLDEFGFSVIQIAMDQYALVNEGLRLVHRDLFIFRRVACTASFLKAFAGHPASFKQLY